VPWWRLCSRRSSAMVFWSCRVVAPEQGGGGKIGGMDLKSYLAELDSGYSGQERMVSSRASTPGYHRRVEPGRVVHSTRTAGDYALALLESGEPARIKRAEAVLQRLVELQTVDPTSRHYGIWSWFLEEPVEQMKPADWNWADFIGARLG